MSVNFVDKNGMNHIEIIEKILKENLKWVFFDEFVVDVSGFMQNHPGGDYMLREVIGEDVGKYINGCSSIGDGVLPYGHTQIARNLLNILVVGKIGQTNDYILNKDGITDDTWNMNWKIAKRYNLSSTTQSIEFKSHKWAVRESPRGFEWIGKHFRDRAVIGSRVVKRYYSLLAANLYDWHKQVQT
ncbi:unnamed protein product [Blepharisma stoltei]|uniref:Cytochrome b5 heme-binding domain-containing protein n=1 Tax=Blepharisma stoltei TaxID=1481888 RepID=A0AAU9JVS0_9CILI|nr:unnamed protein product [Blepharisma stoltei]